MAQLAAVPFASIAASLASAGTIAGSSLATTLAVAGTAASFMGNIAAGNAAKETADYNAKVLEVQGKNEAAVAAKRAGELRREKRLAQSSARAVGAAFGGGVEAGDIAGIEEVGELNALTALWEGEEAMKGRNAQAAVTRLEGKQAKRAGYLKGINTILSGGSSLYEKYGGPQTPTPTYHTRMSAVTYG